MNQNIYLNDVIYSTLQEINQKYYHIYIFSADNESGEITGCFTEAGASTDSGMALESACFKTNPDYYNGIVLTFIVGEMRFELEANDEPYDELHGTLYKDGEILGEFDFSKIIPELE